MCIDTSILYVMLFVVQTQIQNVLNETRVLKTGILNFLIVIEEWSLKNMFSLHHKVLGIVVVLVIVE